MNNITICLKKGGDRSLAEAFAKRINSPDISEKEGKELTVLFDKDGVSLTGFGLTFRGDFEGMLHRVTEGRLLHEMLVKASKSDQSGLCAIDATAGMGEDSFLLAAAGYNVTLHEQNPVIALLLKDALRRGKKQPVVKDIVGRMQLVEGDSVELLANRSLPVDLIYLDPMFPGKQKSSLTNKKLQLIQKLESPCSNEYDLFDAALAANPKKIIVKRPLQAPNLADKKPNYSLNGKAIRYDCYIY